MKLTGHGNGIAITLGVLAVVIAGSGTAVAVTTTTTISDPTVPSRIARVDAAGRLLTAPGVATSTIALNGVFYNSGNLPLTSPTKATLAVTSLTLAETRLNGTTPGSDLTVALVQYSATDTACSTTVVRKVAVTYLASGDHVDLASAAAPAVVAPINGVAYCLGMYSYITDGVADASPYYPAVSLTASVVAGRYTGAGLGATAVGPDPAETR